MKKEIEQNMYDDLLKSSRFDRFMVNDKYEWEFLDEYTFSNFIEDKISPSKSSYADGNILIDDKKYIAQIVITKHFDRNIMSGNLYWKSYNDKDWMHMVNIIKIEKA